MQQIAECRLYTPRRFNSTTRQRFFRHRRGELATHCGGRPSRTQLILIGRIVQNEWDLLRLDAKMDRTELSGHDMRARLAMENRLRLDLRELGMKEVAGKAPSLADYVAAKAHADGAAIPTGAAAHD